MQVILTQKEYEDLLKLNAPGQNTIRFPEEFVALKYPGYYFNTKTKTLFSIKVSGVLHELKKAMPCRFNQYLVGYTVSVNGWNRKVPMTELMQLVPYPAIVPVEGE